MASKGGVAGIYPRGFDSELDWPWPLVKANTVVQLNYGKALREPDRSPGEVPVYGTNGKCGSHNQALVSGPGVILGRKGQGPLGVEWTDSDYWVIDTAYYVTPINDQIDLRYFYYLSKYIGLNHLKDGTSNPSLSRDTFGDLLLPVPPVNTQRMIAKVLQILDDKIELNRKMNETLEATAGVLFKSWFVDFDPVRAKAEGRDTGLPAPTAALFSNSFEDSELGEIPKGWSVKKLGDVTSYLNRGISPTYLESGGTLVLNQKCVRNGAVDLSKGRRHDSTKRSIAGRTLKIGDILVNSTGVGTLGRVAQVLALDEDAIVDSHVTVVRADGSNLSWNYLGSFMGSIEAKIEALGEGSTGQTELSRSRLAQIPLLVPSEPVLEAFDNLCRPMQERRSRSNLESRSLTDLRDAILPKLISGEIRPSSHAREDC